MTCLAEPSRFTARFYINLGVSVRVCVWPLWPKSDLSFEYGGGGQAKAVRQWGNCNYIHPGRGGATSTPPRSPSTGFTRGKALGQRAFLQRAPFLADFIEHVAKGTGRRGSPSVSRMHCPRQIPTLQRSPQKQSRLPQRQTS